MVCTAIVHRAGSLLGLPVLIGQVVEHRGDLFGGGQRLGLLRACCARLVDGGIYRGI